MSYSDLKTLIEEAGIDENIADISEMLEKIDIKLEADPTSAIDAKPSDINTGANVAKGNVALAQGTLMGELGPEIYVTGGRYYVAG